MNMIKAVIFDVDGTLVDTVDMHAHAWQQAFRDLGKEFEFEPIRSQIGKGTDQLLPVFLSEREMEEMGEKIADRRGEIFKKAYLPKAQAFPKVRELFERIRQDGLKIVLASSSPEDELQHYKKLAKITDLIEGATSADDAEVSKPEPDIFAAALKDLGGIDPKDCLVIGDTPYDAIAAGKLGLRCIGLLSGGFPEDSLTANGCIEIYRDPADLLSRYESSALVNEHAIAAVE